MDDRDEEQRPRTPPGVLVELLGGPGDGGQVAVTGHPLPGWLLWTPQMTVTGDPQVIQLAWRPGVVGCAQTLYRLDRATLRYCAQRR